MANRCQRVGVVAAAQGAGDQRGDLRHLRLGHALGGDRGCTDPHAAGDERATRVVGHRVLVERDPGLVERGLGDLAGQLLVERTQVDHHQMVVGAPGDEPEPLPRQRRSERRRVGDDLVGVLAEARLRCLVEGDRLAGDGVLERTALPSGKHGLVDRLGVRRGRQDAAAARAAQGLVGGERDDIGVRHGVGVGAARHESGEVGDVEQQERTDLVGDRPERLGIEPPRVAGGAGHDHLRAVPFGERTHGVHVDPLVGADAVRHEVVQQAAGVDRRAVGEVATVIEAEPEHRVTGLQQCLIGAHVGVRARVWLHVGVLGSEQRLDTFDRDRFDVVDHGVAAVVALARVALGVLVGQHRSGGAHHRRRREVLAGDQLEPGRLALVLAPHQFVDDRVGMRVGMEWHGQNCSSSAVIWATRRACRPPSNGVDKNRSTISSASPTPTTRAPIDSTLASLC